MCNLFVGADASLWESRTKSIRVHGSVTSIRMENMFWDVLEEIAYRDKMSLSQLISTLYIESQTAGHDMTNFTSFLRVCAQRYLALIGDGEVPRSIDTPIYSGNEQDASDIIERESARRRETDLSRAHSASW